MFADSADGVLTRRLGSERNLSREMSTREIDRRERFADERFVEVL